MYIKKSDVVEHGYTVRTRLHLDLAGACEGKSTVTHAEQDWSRKLRGTQKAKNAKPRMRAYVDKKLEEYKQARKRKKNERRREADGGGKGEEEEAR